MWNRLTIISLTVAISCVAVGCADKPRPYGTENRLEVADGGTESWAVAPAVNLSGQRQVDPILQADLLYQQLQSVNGMTAVPVDRVVQILASMQIEHVASPDQASLVCDLLGVKGLLIPTITAFDPYNPPKIGASLTLFRKPLKYVRPPGATAAEMAQNLEIGQSYGLAPKPDLAVGMFDASAGSVRQALSNYAAGRHDPNGPAQDRGYLLDMDAYNGFVYCELIEQVLRPTDLQQ